MPETKTSTKGKPPTNPVPEAKVVYRLPPVAPPDPKTFKLAYDKYLEAYSRYRDYVLSLRHTVNAEKKVREAARPKKKPVLSFADKVKARVKPLVEEVETTVEEEYYEEVDVPEIPPVRNVEQKEEVEMMRHDIKSRTNYSVKPNVVEFFCQRCNQLLKRGTMSQSETQARTCRVVRTFEVERIEPGVPAHTTRTPKTRSVTKTVLVEKPQDASDLVKKAVAAKRKLKRLRYRANKAAKKLKVEPAKVALNEDNWTVVVKRPMKSKKTPKSPKRAPEPMVYSSVDLLREITAKRFDRAQDALKKVAASQNIKRDVDASGVPQPWRDAGLERWQRQLNTWLDLQSKLADRHNGETNFVEPRARPFRRPKVLGST